MNGLTPGLSKKTVSYGSSLGGTNWLGSVPGVTVPAGTAGIGETEPEEFEEEMARGPPPRSPAQAPSASDRVKARAVVFSRFIGISFRHHLTGGGDILWRSDGPVYAGRSAKFPHTPSTGMRVAGRVTAVSMADSKTGTDPEIVPIEGTLLRIVVVFRIIGAAWLLFLAVAVLMTEEPRIDPAVRLGLVVSVMAVAVVGAAVTSILARRNPVVLCQPWFQAIDVLASILWRSPPASSDRTGSSPAATRYLRPSSSPPPGAWERRWRSPS